MADKEQETEKTFAFDDETVNQAAEVILDQGYVTKKDIPEMDDPDWAKAFAGEVEGHFLNDEDHDPFVYYEEFDFVGGDTDSIIFNMDQIPREQAQKLLANAIGQKIQTDAGDVF
ncbi:hypothetical protein [Levilactobacillus bambusae]|uniref:Uncharacterized protein n=1 Tax=Levilactobacillus bambusae TaxID=2024736 RepID=A0A2V1MYH0_9LACO|nr:hypothetical protein [Levilactobacillus bambusae]PWF99861.1 hypothetical protein DCM90_07315 [Levilactobacillus bambusae]